jgi:hypothetical protein
MGERAGVRSLLFGLASPFRGFGMAVPDQRPGVAFCLLAMLHFHVGISFYPRPGTKRISNLNALSMGTW